MLKKKPRRPARSQTDRQGQGWALIKGGSGITVYLADKLFRRLFPADAAGFLFGIFQETFPVKASRLADCFSRLRLSFALAFSLLGD
jgi:hypothetical protein